MEKYKLFLDDEREPLACMSYHMSFMPKSKDIYLEDWTIVRSFSEFISTIDSGFKEGKFIEIVSFDHDLGKKKSGYDCAKWLLNFCIMNDIEMPQFYVHSMNSAGARNIYNTCMDWYKYKEILNNSKNEK